MNISLIMNGYRDTDFESPNPTPLDLCLLGSMKGEVYKRRVDTRDELLFAFWMLLPEQRKREDHLSEQHAIFVHKLQTALRLTVGLSKTLYKLTNLSLLCNKLN
jgi:hypothetical protein